MRVFKIHDLIAYIVGGLHYIDQRVACETPLLEFWNAELTGDAPVYILLAGKKTELSLLARVSRCKWVFHNRRQC